MACSSTGTAKILLLQKVTHQEILDVSHKLDRVLTDAVFRNTMMELLNDGEKNRKIMLALVKQNSTNPICTELAMIIG